MEAGKIKKGSKRRRKRNERSNKEAARGHSRRQERSRGAKGRPGVREAENKTTAAKYVRIGVKTKPFSSERLYVASLTPGFMCV